MQLIVTKFFTMRGVQSEPHEQHRATHPGVCQVCQLMNINGTVNFRMRIGRGIFELIARLWFSLG